MALIDGALALAKGGVSVFPCGVRDKRPLGRFAPRGFLSATTDESEIERIWGACPKANIGLPCAPNGLVVVDIDYRNGGSIPEGLSETFSVETGNGVHLYFSAPEEWVPVGSVGPGIDLKFRGYVLAAGSIHPSGAVYTVRGGDLRPLPQEYLDGWARV